ncbi:MAG: DUF4157 domain-containing protein [Acidobacteriia bacterium]|nr:DUF4157 domain-containing protein [Terriglobia bacterium]
MSHIRASRRSGRAPEPVHLPETAAFHARSAHPGISLQRSLGNQAMLGLLQRGDQGSQAGEVEGSVAPPIVETELKSSGQPLDFRTRRFAERSLGGVSSSISGSASPRSGLRIGAAGDHFEQEAERVAGSLGSGHALPALGRGNASGALCDFRNVRIHHGSRAADSAEAIQAAAYTAGNHIVFGRGRYAPDTVQGRRLLAHELTHVVQQGGMERSSSLARTVRRAPPAGTAQPTAAPAQVTQPLYDQAMASMATKPGVNSTLLSVLQKGKVGQTVAGVHSASTTMQVSVPAPPGSTAGPTSTPAVRVVFDLEISANSAALPAGAFADFVNDAATQTQFAGKPATGMTITRLLKIITKAPPAGATAADLLAEALVHEGTHMTLAIDDLVSQVPGVSGGMSGAQANFAKYQQAAAKSAKRASLDAALLAEVNRVFTPTGATAPTITPANAQAAVASVIAQILEERFAVDQQAAAYPRVVSNSTLAGAYLWDLLADAASKKPWPKGPGAAALVTAMADFLDDVGAILNPPAVPVAPPPKVSPPPTGSATPKKKP